MSVSDDIADVRALLDLDVEARERGVTVVGGRRLRSRAVVRAGPPRRAPASTRSTRSTWPRSAPAARPAPASTTGPSGGTALDWRDGGWAAAPGRLRVGSCAGSPTRSAREDCYRAALPDALLLVPAFPGVGRVTARMAATRRDRLTARLPMLWPPHPEGGPGAVRVEVRGRRGTSRDVRVLGAMDRPAVAAGAVAALARPVGRRGSAATAPVPAGLAELVEPVPFLAELRRRGVRAAVFQQEP